MADGNDFGTTIYKREQNGWPSHLRYVISLDKPPYHTTRLPRHTSSYLSQRLKIYLFNAILPFIEVVLRRIDAWWYFRDMPRAMLAASSLLEIDREDIEICIASSEEFQRGYDYFDDFDNIYATDEQYDMLIFMVY